MPLDQDMFDSVAARGEVAYVSVVASGALRSAIEALERIARASGVDVSAELRALGEDAETLKQTADKLSGYRQE